MWNWLVFFFVIVLVVAKPNDRDRCSPRCRGEEYKCIDGVCYCATGFIQNYFQSACVRCPEFGEKCTGTCCNTHSNVTLQCWHGVCQPCYDADGHWICRDAVDQIFLISTTQVVMGTALILGIVATLVLLFKLCTTASLRNRSAGRPVTRWTDHLKKVPGIRRLVQSLNSRSEEVSERPISIGGRPATDFGVDRPLGGGTTPDSRLSIGSLQMYVDQRLRDAPPSYTRTLPASATIPVAHQNEGFVHDASTPPPPYTEVKSENHPNPTIHI